MAFRSRIGRAEMEPPSTSCSPPHWPPTSGASCFTTAAALSVWTANRARKLWKSAPIDRAQEIQSFYLPILVLYEDVVLFSGGETAGLQTGSWYEKGKDSMTALASGGWESALDRPASAFRIPVTRRHVRGQWTGLDRRDDQRPRGGAVHGPRSANGQDRQQFDPDVATYWFHHRCYRGKATDNYLLMSRTGTEFIDIREQHWDINHWVRGACLYGVMPANGLLYAPRHPCACYLEAKMSGFNALAPESKQPRVATTLRLPIVCARARHMRDAAPGQGDGSNGRLADISPRLGPHGARQHGSACRAGFDLDDLARRQADQSGHCRRAALRRVGRRPHGSCSGCCQRQATLAVPGRRSHRFASHHPSRVGAFRVGRRQCLLPAGRRRCAGMAISGRSDERTTGFLWTTRIRVARPRQRVDRKRRTLFRCRPVDVCRWRHAPVAAGSNDRRCAIQNRR